ncbi:MAG: phosphatase PAP2 family protein [Minicystis sp.]
MNLLPLHRLDAAVCTAFNRINHRNGWSALFGWVSRAGDGVVWYATLATLPLLYGARELPLVACLAGAADLHRPLQVAQGLDPAPASLRGPPPPATTVAPLDRFSFPSGHTLHAVAFTVLIGAVHPSWCWWMVPFTTLVALSRLVLGLHYPSDVLAGAAIGAGASAATYLLGSSCGWF